MTNRLVSVAGAWLAGAVVATAGWEPLPPLPEPNGGFAGGVENGKIVILGGTLWKDDTKHWLRSAHAYDPATRQWSALPGLPSALAYGVVLQEQAPTGGGAFSVLGGTDGSGARKTLVRAAGGEPVALPGLPESLVLSAGGLVGDSRVLVGGTNDVANLAGCTRLAHLVAFADGRWSVRRLPDFPGRPFCTAASGVAGGELFIFGGANWDETAKAVVNTAEAWAWSTARSSWRPLKPYPRAARGVAAVALDEHRLYLAGGYGGMPEQFLAVGFVYDARTNDYAQAPPLPYAALVTLVKHDGWLYCLGGEDRKKHRVDAFWRIRCAELGK